MPGETGDGAGTGAEEDLIIVGWPNGFWNCTSTNSTLNSVIATRRPLSNSSSGGPALSMIETIQAGPNLISRDWSRFQYCPATSGGTSVAVAFGEVVTKRVSETGLGNAEQPADSIRAIKGAVRVTTHKKESTISLPPLLLA